MKKMAEMYDSKIGKFYDLYTMKAQEFVSLVQGVYENQGMTPFFVQRFNEELKAGDYNGKYSELLTSMLRMKEGFEYTDRSRWHNLDSYAQAVKETEERFSKGELFTAKQDRVAAMGYELMPFAISVNGRDMHHQAETLELLDGFRRIFYTHTVPDQEVLVKVYDALDDAEWVSAMIVFNSWKFADERNVLTFLDRGFKLGLYKRHGIDWTALLYYGQHTYQQSLLKYIAQQPFETLWRNSEFARDIRFIEQVKRHQPVFTLKKKKGEDQIFDASNDPYQLTYFLEVIHNVLCKELGRFRRMETEGLLAGEALERQTMQWADYLTFLQAKELQKHFIKLSEMSVRGFIENYISKHLIQSIQLIIHPSLVKTEKKEGIDI